MGMVWPRSPHFTRDLLRFLGERKGGKGRATSMGGTFAASSTDYRPSATARRDRMGFENVWNSHPRAFGKGSRTCRVCNNHFGIIRKYSMGICRQCFRQYAKDIGFTKFR